MTMPAMKAVTSSNIDAVGHDGDALYVRFKSGGTWRYPTANQGHMEAMVAADSPGGYFHRTIKAAHKGERVDG